MSHAGMETGEPVIVLCAFGQGATQRLMVGRTSDRTIRTVCAYDPDANRQPSPPTFVRILAMLATVFHRKS